MALMMILSLTAVAEETDKAYVVNKGKLVVGITDFAPMDFRDDNGEWIGFDADVARAFATELGVDIEFVEIDWDNKILELDGKAVDCIWNGMTLTDAVLAAMECSVPYMNNAQVVVVPADKADAYQTVESLAELSFAAEAGSAVLQRLIQQNGVGVIDAKRAAFGRTDLGGDDVGTAGSLFEEDKTAGIGAEANDLFAEVAVELTRFFVETKGHILVFDSIHGLLDIFDVFVFGFAVQVQLADDQAERIDAGVGHGIEFFDLVFPSVANVAGGNDHKIALVFHDKLCKADTFFQREHFGFRRSAQRKNTGAAKLFIPAKQAFHGGIVDGTVKGKRRDHSGIRTFR
jgi:hypothetical protein